MTRKETDNGLPTLPVRGMSWRLAVLAPSARLHSPQHLTKTPFNEGVMCYYVYMAIPEENNDFMSDKELGQIADKYLFSGELSSEDFLERMSPQQQWFINMIKKMKKRISYSESR